MGARTKLNSASVNGAIVVAALIGYATGSWDIFWLALLVLMASSLYSGAIRPGRGRR
jgi:ABC-type antimicrobial peptide transport system permease subunit